MQTATQPPRQHKQPSRKGKKSWRKNVDISEIQQGLEEVGKQLIKGGVIKERPSTELFALDTTGSLEIRNAYRKGRRPLKVDDILANRSTLPAIETHKKPSSASSRTTDGVIERSTKRKKLSHAEIDRLKQVAYSHGNLLKDSSIDTSDTVMVNLYDPWMDDLADSQVESTAKEEKEEEDRFSFLEKPKPARMPETIKRPPESQLASGKPLPAVIKPDAGRSYNPAFEDWNSLLRTAGAVELDAERQRRAATAADEEMQERIRRSAAEAEQDLGKDDDAIYESEWEGIDSGREETFTKKAVERKTQAQRNKIKRLKQANREAAKQADMKSQEKEAARIASIARAVVAEERSRRKTEVQKAAAEDSDDSVGKLREVLRRRTLGKTPIPEAMLELVLPDELEESLRLLRPEGNLLRDRYRNFVLRGKLESRKPVHQQKKRKVTVTEKWSYKDWKLE